MSLIELTSETFDSQVGSGTTIVEFWAPWCGPCKSMIPVLDGLAERFAGRATVAKVNCDEQPNLVEQFKVRSIPFIIILRDGKVITSLVGMQRQDILAAAIERVLV